MCEYETKIVLKSHCARLSPEEQSIKVNPFCATFPLEVSCTVPNVGAAGGEQNHNGLCVLSQNIINEKMYIAIWFWTVFLIFVVPLLLIYRTLTLTFKCVRAGLLMSKYFQRGLTEFYH